MREISAPLTDIDANLHLVFLENGKPKLESMSVLKLAQWKDNKPQANVYELAGVFLDLPSAQSMVNDLTNGKAIFVPID